MNTSTVLVIGVLGVLVFMYLKQANVVNAGPPATNTNNTQGGGQQVSAQAVFDGILGTINHIFDGVKEAAQTSPQSV